MTRIIYCSKLEKEAEGLDFIPYPGDLGKKIYQEISKKAWEEWLMHQTILINEYRLSTLEKKSRDFLKMEMEKFLFGTPSISMP